MTLTASSNWINLLIIISILCAPFKYDQCRLFRYQLSRFIRIRYVWAVIETASMDAVETFDPLRSRPNTPVKVVWYDFLLDDGLLERHLSQENPDPPALHLAAEFVHQYQVGLL